jgi:hypothetical protein
VSIYRVTTTRHIHAPARVAYDIIADYRDMHARMVPPKWFSNLRVDSGGVGAGTTIRYDVRAFGATKTHRARVDEPTPGRVLVESEIDDPIVTTFSVEPTSDGSACEVTITSQLQSRDGFLGTIEQWLARPTLKRIFAAELDRLDTLARSVARLAAA